MNILDNDLLSRLFWRATAILAKQGIQFVAFVVCLRYLAPYDFGAYNYAIAVMLLVSVFSDFGISTATSRYVATHGKTYPEKVRSVLFSTASVLILTSIVVLSIGLIIGRKYFGSNIDNLLFLIPSMIFAPLIALYDGIYRGSGKTEFVSKITLIAGILSLIPVIFLVKTYLLWGALMSQNLYLGVLLLILALNYRSFDVKIDTEVVREIVRYSLIIGGISTAYTLFAKVDTLILGHYGYVTEIGYFELANKVIFLLLLPAAIFSQVESPTIAALSKESGSRSLIIKKLNVYTLIFVIMGILLAISTYLIALPILEHYFTKYYIPQVVTILSIYLLTYVFHSVADAIGNTFIVSTGHARLNLINVFVFGLISTTLAVIFIAKYGYIGLVYSKLLTVPLSSIVLLTWYNIAIRRS